jgi:hypothetical protein
LNFQNCRLGRRFSLPSTRDPWRDAEPPYSSYPSNCVKPLFNDRLRGSIEAYDRTERASGLQKYGRIVSNARRSFQKLLALSLAGASPKQWHPLDIVAGRKSYLQIRLLRADDSSPITLLPGQRSLLVIVTPSMLGPEDDDRRDVKRRVYLKVFGLRKRHNNHDVIGLGCRWFRPPAADDFGAGIFNRFDQYQDIVELLVCPGIGYYVLCSSTSLDIIIKILFPWT